MYGNNQLIEGALNYDFGNPSFIDTCIQIIPDLIVFNQLVGIVLFVSIPVAVPSTDDS
jgi:hypothetical protein